MVKNLFGEVVALFEEERGYPLRTLTNGEYEYRQRRFEVIPDPKGWRAVLRIQGDKDGKGVNLFPRPTKDEAISYARALIDEGYIRRAFQEE